MNVFLDEQEHLRVFVIFKRSVSKKYILDIYFKTQLRIHRNFCSVHEEITSIRLYTPCNPRSGLRKGVYNYL